MMGKELDVQEYNSQGFDEKKGGPLRGAKDFDCDFESRCCYINEQNPFDALDWYSVQGRTDPSLLRTNFNGVPPPKGQFLAASKSIPVNPNDEARFTACSLECTDRPIKFTLKHWRSPGTVLQVCQKDSFVQEKPPTNCQTINTPDPGPTTLTLPSATFTDMVVIGKGFTNFLGSMIAIDDIVVDYTPCRSKSLSNPNEGGGVNPLCKTIACDFDDGNSCGYTPVTQGQGRSSQFSVRTQRTGNRETGVPAPADGSGYLASDIEPGTMAVIQSADLSGSESKQLHLRYYEAVDQFLLQVCRNDLSKCEDVSNAGVSIDDRAWKDAIIQLPPDTKKFFIVGKNQGTNQGAVGVDSITLTDEKTSESLC